MSGGTRSFEIARRLVKMGHEVEIITTWLEPTKHVKWFETNEDGVKVHWLSNLYSNDMNFFKRIFSFIRFSLFATKKALSLNAVDIVFATSTPLTIAIPGLITAKIKKIPMVFEVRDLWPSVPIAMGFLKNSIAILIAKKLEIYTYKKSKHIIALAPGMKREIASLGVPINKISVITNGYDPYLFSAQNSRIRSINLRKKFTWLQNRKLILFAGAFGRANGVPYLVDIAKEMERIDPEIRFLLIGDGYEKPLVKNKALNLNILNKNLFLMEPMSKNEIVNWLLISNFSVALFSGPRSLWKDAVQNKFFDSLGAGVPIACNFRGYQSEIAVKNDVGIIIDKRNAKKAALEIYEKLIDTDWQRRVTINAKKLAFQQFNFDKLCIKFESILNNALK